MLVSWLMQISLKIVQITKWFFTLPHFSGIGLMKANEVYLDHQIDI